MSQRSNIMYAPEVSLWLNCPYTSYLQFLITHFSSDRTLKQVFTITLYNTTPHSLTSSITSSLYHHFPFVVGWLAVKFTLQWRTQLDESLIQRAHLPEIHFAFIISFTSVDQAKKLIPKLLAPISTVSIYSLQSKSVAQNHTLFFSSKYTYVLCMT